MAAAATGPKRRGAGRGLPPTRGALPFPSPLAEKARRRARGLPLAAPRAGASGRAAEGRALRRAPGRSFCRARPPRGRGAAEKMLVARSPPHGIAVRSPPPAGVMRSGAGPQKAASMRAGSGGWEDFLRRVPAAGQGDARRAYPFCWHHARPAAALDAGACVQARREAPFQLACGAVCVAGVARVCRLEGKRLFNPAQFLVGVLAPVVGDPEPLVVPRLQAHHVGVPVVVEHLRQLALDAPVPLGVVPRRLPRLPDKPVVYPAQGRVEQHCDLPVVHIAGPDRLKPVVEPPATLALPPVPSERRGRHFLAFRS